MAGGVSDFFSSDGFLPHAECYHWDSALLWTQVISNGLIGLSFLAIAVTLVVLRMRAVSMPFRRTTFAFGTFLVCCALSHFALVFVTFTPLHAIDTLLRVVTAIASLGTVFLLPRLVPRALSLTRGAAAARRRGIELEAAVEGLERMYETTKELERIKTQFFANVSHELRTPLTLILGPTERLLAAPNLREEQRRDLALVTRNARMLLRQVNDLLDVSRLEAGRLELRYSRTDLSKLVQQTAAHFDALARERNLRFVTEVPDSLPAELDVDLVQRVLLNLVSNAFKFTPESGQIRISARDLGEGRAVIEVADNGAGVSAEHRELIFERFRQADASATRRFGGAGLGLAIAKDFVELHNGTLEVADAPEGGALFLAEIPTIAPEGTSVKETPSERPSLPPPEASQLALDELWSRAHSGDSLAPAPAAERPLVLVVEDNLDMNRFVCQTLSLDYRTEPALDGRQGLEKALRLLPDVIVSDLMMPGMSGDQLVQAIRNSPELIEVPILLLTAKSDETLRTRMLREGAQDYVMKPFAADELRARVSNLVTVKRTRQLLQKELGSEVHDVELLAREIASQKRELQNKMDSMRVARQHAEQQSKLKSGFLGMMSHELRTPLASLQLQLERLLASGQHELPPERQMIVRRMSASIGRVHALIEGLLHFARIESGRFNARAETVDVARLAQDVLDELQMFAEEKGVALMLNVEDAPPDFESDASLVRLILLNLIDNGLRSTEHGQVRITIRFDERSCRLTVADTGPGIPREHQSRLFATFDDDSTRHKQLPGTGLALALTRELVTALGGSITVSSKVGHGTKFSVRVPHRTSAAPIPLSAEARQ
ncbi:MAG TPA: ATP-binding protein [Polyangiales bacterium]|jgi:signal transduction histidine kinase|nr:ATP-binding protein [Polyangiales bacterium]